MLHCGKKNSLHRVIGRSPFKAVFGSDPKLGVQCTNLPQYLLPKITTEEELEQFKTQLINQEYHVQEQLQVISEISRDKDEL